jgi:hypothetical protein
VILGDYEQLANIVPKKEYSLVIVDIPHGYNTQNIGYDTEPYTYQAFNKVVKWDLLKSQYHHFGGFWYFIQTQNKD